jgi:hypothetical protein
VMVNRTLMRTTDNGKNWVDITPELSAPGAVTAAYFLDEDTGWSVLSASSRSGEFTSVRVVSTSSSGGFLDGRSAIVPVSTQFLGLWSGAAYITFSDAKHGWLGLQRNSSSNFKAGIIFRTQDGGRSWTELPIPPTVDNMRFISSDVGWIAGGPGGGSLYRTADGGQSWTDDRVPQPPATIATTTFYSVPQIGASGGIFLAVTFVKSTAVDDSATLAIYTSNDMGATWESYSVRGGISASSRIPTDLAGRAFVSVYDEAKGAKPNSEANENDARRLTRIRAPIEGAVLSAYFVDNSNGWLVVANGVCEKKGSCESRIQLLATPDGGASTLDITPKPKSGTADLSDRPQPELVSATTTSYPGFDTCAAPSSSQCNSGPLVHLMGPSAFMWEAPIVSPYPPVSLPQGIGRRFWCGRAS